MNSRLLWKPHTSGNEVTTPFCAWWGWKWSRQAQTVNIEKQPIEIKNSLGSWRVNDTFILVEDIEAFSFPSVRYQVAYSWVDAAEMCCDGLGGKERAAQRKPSFVLSRKIICGQCWYWALLEIKILSLWNTGVCFLYQSRKCLKNMSSFMSKQWLTPLDPIRNNNQ